MDTDLYSVARTSRTLFSITEPLLYTRYIQNGSQQSSAFLRTILEKPEYASRVKIMHGNIWSDDDCEPDEDEDEDEDADGSNDRQSNDRDLALFIKTCETHKLPSNDKLTHEQWVAALQAQKPEALFAVAVLLLPNLKSLSMTTNGYHDDPNSAFFSQAITCSAQSSDPSLKNLEEISYAHEYTEANISLEEILPFFYLPSLRKFDVVSLSAESFAWERPLTSTSIKGLSFSSSGIADEAWPVLLRPMHQLKHLCYSTGKPKHVGSTRHGRAES